MYPIVWPAGTRAAQYTYPYLVAGVEPPRFQTYVPPRQPVPRTTHQRHLISSPEYPPVTTRCLHYLSRKFPFITPIQLSSSGGIVSLEDWMCALFYRTQMNLYHITGALELLSRIWKSNRPITTQSGYELLLGACMIAHKVMEDAFYTLRDWCTCALGVITSKRLAEVEREILACLSWGVHLENPGLETLGKRVFGTMSLGGSSFF